MDSHPLQEIMERIRIRGHHQEAPLSCDYLDSIGGTTHGRVGGRGHRDAPSLYTDV